MKNSQDIVGDPGHKLVLFSEQVSEEGESTKGGGGQLGACHQQAGVQATASQRKTRGGAGVVLSSSTVCIEPATTCDRAS